MVYDDGLLGLRRKREGLRELQIPEIDRGLDVILFLEDTCKALDREVHEAWLRSPEAQLLSTIPGVGELTSVALVAFICPIDRFSTPEKLSSYVGLCPSTRQSGEVLHHGPMKRDSNSLLRWLLTEASWIHARRVPRGAVAKMARRVGSSARQGTRSGSAQASEDHPRNAQAEGGLPNSGSRAVDLEGVHAASSDDCVPLLEASDLGAPDCELSFGAVERG